MRKWLPLAAVCLGSFMLIVDTTVVTVALPGIGTGLHASLSNLQWVMNIYTLVLAALTLSAGSLGDLLGRRRVYLLSLAVFGGASLLCAVATSPGVLIAARGIQGIGGAAMFVTSMALLGTTFEGRERGTAMGVWSATIGVAAAIGPVFGGLLTQGMSWRAIFYVNIPISLVTMLLTRMCFTESRPSQRPRIDIAGIATFALASGALTYALILAGDKGWTSNATLGLFALAALGAVLFVVAERRHPNPMLDLSLMRNASFAAIMLSTVAAAWGFSSLVFTSLWLQSVVGLSPVKAGLALLPLAGATFVASTLTGKRLHDVSPRVTITASLLLIGAGCALNGLLVDGGSSWAAAVPGLLVIGLGIGVGMPATGSAVFASVPPQRAGMGSGAMATFRQLGQALGVAILGVVFTDAVHSRLTGKADDPQAAQDALTGGRRTATRVVHDAGAHGLTSVYLVTAGLALVAALLTVSLIRSKSREASPRAAARETVRTH
ncbi:MFS transporter [Streptomyces sp. Li-HN-5-11]|uniref:MFS transporter n=1 Tax=Streptomyces sp. Li-HN-5-11 TaxID=3075432 RepID=UPI0028AEB9FB|nr:MFS transporter [Streptomyces sp. Li-HN-5-11]WNM29016.1 MFS transporter [Streptomyces sp. Li-HN-5-11]